MSSSPITGEPSNSEEEDKGVEKSMVVPVSEFGAAAGSITFSCEDVEGIAKE